VSHVSLDTDCPCILKFPCPPRKKRPPKVLPVPLRWPDAMNLLAVCLREQESTRGSRRLASNRDYVVLHLGLYLGLRCSEMCNIRCEDFDFIERVARVNQGKGAKDRVVPIPLAAMPVFEAWAKGRHGIFVPNRRGLVFNPRCVHNRVQRLGIRAGLPWLHPHSLRHAAALRLMCTGSHIRKIQAFLGHRDLRCTQIYLDVLPLDLREDCDRM